MKITAKAEKKAHGVHYTPVKLAEFLARVAQEAFVADPLTIRILDPACGDGILLKAIAETFPSSLRKRLALHGYERSGTALDTANSVLRDLGVATVELQRGDFLSLSGGDESGSKDDASLTGDGGLVEGARQTIRAAAHLPMPQRFDVVIANPPYVRTQVLGAKQAQALARRFGLSGRIDLYQAFARAMADLLRPDGVLGLLTSNRFLTTKSGAALRRILTTEFRLASIFDLGDTKLFDAAVLPAIVVGIKGLAKPRGRAGTRELASSGADCCFHRVYEYQTNGQSPADLPAVPAYDSVLDALMATEFAGPFRSHQRSYVVERGTLWATSSDAVWTLSTPSSRRWLQQIELHSAQTFDDVANVRVGIKTTADAVFVRDDWQSLPADCRPEPELLHPLITHREASRWVASAQGCQKQVLYPHRSVNGVKTVIDVKKYPRCSRYFDRHRAQLESRQYVINAGRRWYEIWVPHHPSDWPRTKIVFPDISLEPRFFLDDSGAVVQGDCYWITLRPNQDSDWLYLMLAVANSTFITKFYDTIFHNKLYAGRRRFMTQYVKQFPLPDLSAELAQDIVHRTKAIVRGKATKAMREEQTLNDLVWRVFGLENATL